jgi:nucleoside-diphosphate-sugar epimerase
MTIGEKGKGVLVTGAAGFIGSFLCPRLIREGYEVTALDMDEKKAAPLKQKGMDVVIGDLTKPKTIKGACDDIGTVIHLAAHVKSWGTKKVFFDSIFHATKNLLDEAAKNQCRFIYFSSICAAGAGGIKQHLTGHREDDPEKITGASFYCDAKYEAEKLVQEYHRQGRVKATIIRPANVIGPRSVWVTDMIETMQKGPVFPVIDGGRYNGCFVYVENLVDGIVLAITNDVASGRTYHFRDDYDETWKDYIVDLAAILGREVKFVNIPFPLAWGLGYLSDKLLRPLNVKITISRHTVGLTGRDNSVDTSRARNELGWKTRIPYQKAMEEIERWVKEEYLSQVA